MYRTFYGLKEKPFQLLPDPAFLYLSRQHKMALTLLEYSLESQVSFCVVTGAIGAGKTTLIRHLLSSVEPDLTVGLITNTGPSIGDVLQWVLMAFDLDYRGKGKVEMFQTLLEFLIAEYARGKRTVLIVDEAQNMAPTVLEELRMLSNINADKHQVLQMVLVGQPRLREVLRRPDLEQFAQRVAVDYRLEPLDVEETRAYIHHRLDVAGRQGTGPFADAACEAVYRYSGGIPRVINVLCDTALVYGFAEQMPEIDARIVAEVAADKRRGGIFPIRAGDDDGRSHALGENAMPQPRFVLRRRAEEDVPAGPDSFLATFRDGGVPQARAAVAPKHHPADMTEPHVNAAAVSDWDLGPDTRREPVLRRGGTEGPDASGISLRDSSVPPSWRPARHKP